MVTLIDNTVSVTTRHSESVPIASEVAMALANREEATGAGWFVKPTVPGNRIMLRILEDARANHPAISVNFTTMAGNIAATRTWKAAKSGQRLTLFPLLLTSGDVLARK